MVARSSASPALVKAPAASPLATYAAAIAAWLVLAVEQYRGPGAASFLRALILADVSPVAINVIATGMPGTGKTAMTAAWAAATCGVDAFLPITFSPWTDPAEFLGSMDIDALSRGEYIRSTRGKRPTMTHGAKLALCDELPRGSPATKAAMLPILSDRVTATWDPVTARTIVAGANTRMTSEEDKALVDRFALKVDVDPVESAPDLRAVIGRNVPVDGAKPTAAPLPVLPAGAVDALRAHAATVDMPGEVLDAIVALAIALRLPVPSGGSYPYVSPRRWVIATRLLQASAALRGADHVDWCDLASVLPMVLDDGAESRPALKTAIEACVPKWVRAVADVEASCAVAVERAYRCGDGVPRKGEADAHVGVNTELNNLAASVKSYGADVTARVDAVVERTRDACTDAYNRGLTSQQARTKAAR